MAHLSENSKSLEIKITHISKLDELNKKLDIKKPEAFLFWMPAGRSDQDASKSSKSFLDLADFCRCLEKESTICFLTTPSDGARLLPHFESILKFQLWIAVELDQNTYKIQKGELPKKHASLIILTGYSGPLKHTKTRIAYTYCPACGKTTKDYGGKKHTYHEYGTLISDVWRDITCNPYNDINDITIRLSDLFGIEPYQKLHVIDLRSCLELNPNHNEINPTLNTTHINLLDVQMRSQLINGDCLEKLGTIPDNSMDLCFADPPYNLKKKYDRWNDAIESIEYFRWCDKWLAELARVLKPGRSLIVVNIPLCVARYYQYLTSKLNFQYWITWDALGFPARMIMPAHYAVLCFSKGEPRQLPGLSNNNLQNYEDIHPMQERYCIRSSCIAARNKLDIIDKGEPGDLWYDIHRLKHNSRRADHPCQLPPKLMRRVFALFTSPGEIILDCFNGAGTSTLVADQMGRRFIGIELSQEYHKIALSRHERLKNGIDPFDKCYIVPKAKNSPVNRLPKQTYRVSKKTLQLEIKRIAEQIGRLPTREDVIELSIYPLEYFTNYFISWGEVCAAARTTGMSELPPGQEKKPLPLKRKEKRLDAFSSS